ncbi:hypothetical protein QBC40DRAFT_187535 [Triangularia verruculosa]|uniref:Uncharacterized protein n=1 Tax=Triangularia verruculosa TaxID=2587418 RepID=A0AAN7AQF7_9PEZI|nr:hypothetical protein QBC40DRAFT_187535 [Triangularia verruculosa]
MELCEISPDNESIKKDILDALTSISPTGFFASCGTLNGSLNPPPRHLSGTGDVGHIHEILDGDQVDAMIYQHRQDTGILDDAWKGTFALDSNEFFFRDDGWNQYVQNKLCPHVAQQLGMATSTPIRARLQNMLLTDPIPEGFGTLVITLPTIEAHEGGDVILTHSGSRIVYNSSAMTIRPYPSYAVWYSDVSCEFRPVHSGHRCMLVYTLIVDTEFQPARPSAAQLPQPDVASLQNALGRWYQSLPFSGGMDCLYHVLDNARAPLLAAKYTPGTSIDELKGKDLAQARML